VLEIGGKLYFYSSNDVGAKKVRAEYYGVVFACCYDGWTDCCDPDEERTS
jgi:hypothetical protein